MALSSSVAAICFIACHGGPADHFATFAQHLSEEGKKIEIHATGPAAKKFEDRGIKVNFPFSLDNLSPEEEDALAESIAKTCSCSSVIITDLGHAFDIKIQKALARHVTHIPRLAYYDNPEPYVPGGYSKVAAEVMKVAERTLFANATLAKGPVFEEPGIEVDFTGKEKVGIGYYPVEQAKKIADRKEKEHLLIRTELFAKNAIVDTRQKVLVYFGGNNEEYYEKAFPAFLSLVQEGMKESSLGNYVILLQQHPGAKEKNRDRAMFETWAATMKAVAEAPKLLVSDFNSDNAQVVADMAMYYQTSMGPQFVLTGIPTMQIGHETYHDILVRNRLSPSVTNPSQLVSELHNLSHPKKKIPHEVIFEGLGINPEWLEVLKKSWL